MASSSTPTEDASNTTGIDPQIEHHSRTLPITPEELDESLPHPSLAEQFKEMKERLLDLKNRSLLLLL